MYHDRKLHPFGLRRQEMIQHVAVFGRSGSGKTNTIFRFIDQLLRAEVPFLIFDWKRNYRAPLSLTDQEILIFTVGRPVAPIRFNPLIPPPGVEPQVHLKLLVNIIAKAYFCGDGVISLLQQAIDHVYAEAGVYMFTTNCSRSWRIRSTKSTRATANGSVMSLMPTSLTWPQ